MAPLWLWRMLAGCDPFVSSWGMTTSTPPGSRAIIYARISRDREGAGLGIERQREDCEALAAELRLDVVTVYEDNDLSAYSGKPRPGYTALLEDLREGKAEVVLAWHTDRLHRSPAELEEYIDVCEPRRIATRTVKAGQLDLTTATGRMIARQLGVQARYEVERMVERQRRKRDQMAAAGSYMGGARPFGYEADGVTIREEEAAAIREAADALLAGASLRAVCRDWAERGIRTVPRARRAPDGGRSEPVSRAWDATELRRMLLRPRNAGIAKHRGEEAGPASWPPVLDEPTWRSLCAVLTKPERRTTPGNERKYLGSGVYVCGVCGETMRCSTISLKDRSTVPAYRCRSGGHVHRRQAALDAYVTALLLSRIRQPDAVEHLAQREDPVDVRGAQREMREARARLDELASELGAGVMDMQEWRAASAPARARLRAAEDLMSRAVQVNPVAGLLGAADPAVVWNGWDLSRRRAALAYLMTVTVHRARIGRLPGGARLDTDSIEVVWK